MTDDGKRFLERLAAEGAVVTAAFWVSVDWTKGHRGNWKLRLVVPMSPLPSEPLFKWETLREIGPHDLGYAPLVPGKMCEVQLTSGATVQAWRADDGQQYFCHGLTFGGKDAPGGPISPFTGRAVETILQQHYQAVPEAESRPGDILVWRGIAPDTTPHSAVLADVRIAPGKTYLDEATRLQSKNGMLPEQNLPLRTLIRDYGESYNVFRRR